MNNKLAARADSTTDKFTKVTYRRKKKNNSFKHTVRVRAVTVTYPKINSFFEIYELFINIFSYTNLIDKIRFRLVSKQCRVLMNSRLEDPKLCDDIDEFVFCKKDNMFREKFIDKNIFGNKLSDLLIGWYTPNDKIFEHLLKNESVFVLNKIIRRNICSYQYVCYRMINTLKNISDTYKNNINNYIFNGTCMNKKKCSLCSKLIYLCLENDWFVPNNFFNGLLDVEIFDMMVVAGCHGNFNMFVTIYNHLMIYANYFNSNSKMNTVMVLICYYRIFCLEQSSNDKLFRYSKLNNLPIKINNIGFDKIIMWYHSLRCSSKWILPCKHNSDLNIDKCISEIFEECNLTCIQDVFYDAILNEKIDIVNFWEKYVNDVSDKIIILLLNKCQDKIFKDLSKKIIMKKYGDISMLSFVEIIADADHIKLTECEIIFYKYYLSLYEEKIGYVYDDW